MRKKAITANLVILALFISFLAHPVAWAREAGEQVGGGANKEYMPTLRSGGWRSAAEVMVLDDVDTVSPAEGGPPYPSAQDPVTFEVETIAYLRDYAENLSAQGTPGVELYTDVARKAVEIYSGRNDMGIQQKYDAVVRDLTIVFTGGNAASGYLLKYEDMQGRLGGAVDPLVDTNMGSLVVLSGLDPGYAEAAGGGTLDTAMGADFRAEYNDAGANQIYHGQFYVWMGYNTQDSWGVSRANMFHEFQYNVGGSVEDYNLGIGGASTGMIIRSLRDAGSAEGFQMIPEIIGAAFSNQPESYVPNAGLRNAIIDITNAKTGSFLTDLFNSVAMAKDRALIQIIEFVYGE